MAYDTPADLRNLVIYSVYVRNHGPNGTFADVEADLPRIRQMGVDLIWLMPVHPIGKVNRKGSMGSPYSIVDYRGINPEYGTLEDFTSLVEKTHSAGMRIMIDVVYNHTAHDSLLVHQHPDWFHQDASGNPVTTVPDWSDVIDLKHPNPALTAYLHETLQYWAALGVDGFRCDVASLLPEEFWVTARQAVAKVRPGVIWLAEAVHTSWVVERRANDLAALSDSEVYRAFDLTYDYDIWTVFRQALHGQVHFGRYLEMLLLQDGIYPATFIKMRCTENHDQPRILAFAPSLDQALAWTAFEAFNKGAFLIYAGQEAAARHTPSLFEIDKIDWQDLPLQSFIATLARLKKDPALVSGKFQLIENRDTLQAAWRTEQGGLFGVFNVQNLKGEISIPLPDGDYRNELDGELVAITGGKMVAQPAAVFRFSQPLKFQLFKSSLF
jgi:glycosidase